MSKEEIDGKIAAAYGSENLDKILAYWNSLPQDVREQADLAARSRQDTPQAFAAFYKGIHGNDMLDFNWDAFQQQHKAHMNGEIFLYLGFRGCRKDRKSVV